MVNLSKKNKAVFFDRDGVLNHSNVRNGRPYAPTNLDQFSLIEDASKAVELVKSLGYLIIVVTNQPDVGRGILKRETLNAMHKILKEYIQIDDIYTCEHSESCPCYKPNPGMLHKAAEKWGINLGESYMVGDRWRDVGAGNSAGCQTIFIDYGYDEPLIYHPTKTVNNIAEACAWIGFESKSLLKR